MLLCENVYIASPRPRLQDKPGAPKSFPRRLIVTSLHSSRKPAVPLSLHLITYHFEKMRSVLIVLSLVAAVMAIPAAPQNGQVLSKCDDVNNLGDKSCVGTGFITCTHRGNIFRPCGAGTACQVDPGDAQSILCI